MSARATNLYNEFENDWQLLSHLLEYSELTNLPLDKMATTTPLFWNENVFISIWISLKFIPNVPICNIPTLIQIMAWRRPGAKPLSEPMLTRFTDTYNAK